MFENFYQKLSNISVQYINSGQKTKLCFIDERLKETPFFSNIKTTPFLVNSACDYDGLVSGLEKINFIQSKSVEFWMSTRFCSFSLNRR